jgi:hypothetical protein
MTKPGTIDGYSERVTRDCERVLVSILRHLGPWKESVFLVGGMTPRYLVRDRPPQRPPEMVRRRLRARIKKNDDLGLQNP